MRVQDRTSLGTSAAEAGRTQETQTTRQDRSGRSRTSSSVDGDRVELSTTLGRLSQAIAADGLHRTQRVQALAVDYQAHRYQPNSEATSRALIAEALQVESR